MEGEDEDEVEVVDEALLITVVEEGVEGAGEAADPRGVPVVPVAPDAAPTLLSTSATNKKEGFIIRGTIIDRSFQPFVISKKYNTKRNGDKEIGIDYWYFCKKIIRLVLPN